MSSLMVAPRKYWCVMESTPIADGRWHHRCLKCNITRESNRPNYARACSRWYHGLGSRVAWVLEVLWIDRLFRRPNCRCDQRREWLDRLLPWL